MASWLAYATALGLVLVGVRRWGGNAISRRCIGVAAAAAGAALIVGLPPLPQWLGSWEVPHLGMLVQALLICTAGTALFAAAQRVAMSATLLSVPPVGVGLSISAIQVTLFFAATGNGRTDDPQIEVAMLWVVTVGWPAVAAAVLLSSLRLWGSTLRGPTRTTAELLRVGLLVLAMGGLLHGLRFLPVAPAPRHHAVAVATQLSDAITVVGLLTIALGLAVPDLSKLAAPAWRWGRAALVLHRLRQLATELGEATPEWDSGGPTPSWAWSDARHLEPAVYRAVIRIRDATWTLLGAVEDVEIRHAITVALRARPGGRQIAVAALAEACWLRRAVHRRTHGSAPPTRPYALRVLERAPDEAIGSLDDEVAFLSAVARAWRSRTARSFGARACSGARCDCGASEAATSRIVSG